MTDTQTAVAPLTFEMWTFNTDNSPAPEEYHIHASLIVHSIKHSPAWLPPFTLLKKLVNYNPRINK